MSLRPDFPDPAVYSYQRRDVWLRVNRTDDIEQTNSVVEKRQWLTEPGDLYVNWTGSYRTNTFRVDREAAAEQLGATR